MKMEQKGKKWGKKEDKTSNYYLKLNLKLKRQQGTILSFKTMQKYAFCNYIING